MFKSILPCLSNSFPSLPILIMILSALQCTNCSYSYQTGYEIRDLLSTTGACFETEIAQWTASSLKSSAKIFSCNGTSLLGGQNILKGSWFASGRYGSYGQYFQRQFTGLPPHQTIRFSMKVWAIDSWDLDDRFEISFDGNVVTGWQTKTDYFPSNLCGTVYKDLPNIQVFGRRDHSATTLTLKIISKFDEDTENESFGIRELSLLLVTTKDSQDQCAKAPISQFWGQTVCQCSEGNYYKTATSTCEPCHTNCVSCFGPGANQCYQCQNGRYFDGTSCLDCDPSCGACSGSGATSCIACPSGSVRVGSQCYTASNCGFPLLQDPCLGTCKVPCDPNDFVYWDGSCAATCPFPFQSSTISTIVGTVKKCEFPCANNQYLYWNGACESSCTSPLSSTTVKGVNLCNYPCTGTQHLYWNGTCTSGCNSPLLPVSKWGEDFCTYPCSGTQQLYWNGSCIDGCPAPLASVMEGNKQFCRYQCTGTDWLYWNGSCISSCSAPLTQRVEGGKQFCDYPCLATQFLYWNGSCLGSCATPFVSKIEAFKKYCVFPCASSEYLYPNGTCYSTCDGVPRTEAGKNLCQPGCLPGEFLYWNGTCSPSCPFPLAQRVDAQSRSICVHDCPAGEFLYWDASCSAACDIPLLSVMEGGKLFCRFPCLTGPYLHWNDSCLNECNTPLISTTIKGKTLCKFNCTRNQSPLLNGSCADECPFPYTMKFYVNQYFCDFYCPLGQYLETISTTCVNVCPSEYFGYDETRFCQKCQVKSCKTCSTFVGQKCDECLPYMMLDNRGLCNDCQAMQISYVKETDTGHQYTMRLIPSECDLDESFVQEYLQATEQSKASLPPFSFQVKKKGNNLYTIDLLISGDVSQVIDLNVTLKHLNGITSVPKMFQETPLIKKFAELAPSISSALLGVSAGSTATLLSLGTSTALWNMINFQQFIGYFIYINVDYPPQTELFLSLFQFSSLDFLPNPFKKLTHYMYEGVEFLQEMETADKYQPPRKFVKYEVGSFFIENGGSALSTSLGFFLAVKVAQVLKRVRIFRIDMIMSKILGFLRWNCVLRAFLENGIPLALAIFLQARKTTYHTFYSAFCMMVTIAAFAYYLLMMFFSVDVLVNTSLKKLRKPVVKEVYGTLYEGSTLETESCKYYHILILSRGVLLVFLAVFFEISPVLQIIPLIVFNIGLIYYLFKAPRFEDKFMNVINKVKEILILLGEIGILLLALGSQPHFFYSNLGWAIVGCLGSALVIELLYTVILQIISIGLLFRKIRGYWRNTRQILRKQSRRTLPYEKKGTPERPSSMELGSTSINMSVIY